MYTSWSATRGCGSCAIWITDRSYAASQFQVSWVPPWTGSGLRTRLLLLAFVQCEQRHARHLDHLEAAAWDISLGLASLSETRDQHLILHGKVSDRDKGMGCDAVQGAHVLVDEVQAAVARDEASNLLSVLDELHPDTLTNGRVGLLGLKAAVDGSAKHEDNAKKELTSSPQQYPWTCMSLQEDLPSCGSQSETCCTACSTISPHGDGYAACDLRGVHLAY